MLYKYEDNFYDSSTDELMLDIDSSDLVVVGSVSIDGGSRSGTFPLYKYNVSSRGLPFWIMFGSIFTSLGIWVSSRVKVRV